MGVFWPARIYAAHFKKRISRRKFVVRNGVKGMILDSSATERIPDGCTAIYALDQKGIEVHTELGGNEGEVEEGDFNRLVQTSKASVQLARKEGSSTDPKKGGVVHLEYTEAAAYSKDAVGVGFGVENLFTQDTLPGPSCLRPPGELGWWLGLGMSLPVSFCKKA